MSKGSKQALIVLIVTHTQHCIQSTVTQFVAHVKRVESVKYYVLYSVYRVSKGNAIYLKAFHLVGLAVHHQSVQGASFINFLGLVKLQGWLQARHTANPQFLKLTSAQQPVILTYLQQSCILHTLNKLSAQCNFDPLESVGSISGKVGSREQVD